MSNAFFCKVNGVNALVNCKGTGGTIIVYQFLEGDPVYVQADRIETFYPCEGTMILAVRDDLFLEMDSKDGYYLCARACRNGCKVEW